MSARTAVLVLHWRSIEETEGALESALGGTRRADLLVAVDHRGEASEIARLRARFSGIAVLEPGRNLGFAAGNNAAMREAIECGCTRVLLLNDDARLLPETLERLESALDADPGAAMAGPLIVFEQDPGRVWFAGGRIDWRKGATAHVSAGASVSAVAGGPPAPVDYLTGCVLLAETRLIEEIGGLDETYFLYFEEADWCERARRAGRRLLFVPAARAVHRVSPGDTYSSNPAKVYYFTRNRLLFMKRYREQGLDTRFRLHFARYLGRLAWGIGRRGGRRRLASARAILAALRDYRAGRFGERQGL